MEKLNHPKLNLDLITKKFYPPMEKLSYQVQILLSLYKNYNFPAIILRLYLVYGPNQDTNRIIPYTILNSLLDNDFHCSSGKQYRDFLYIDDLQAIFKTLKK